MRKEKEKNIDNKIVNYVESFFEELHYSKEIESAKEKIILKLNDEYFFGFNDEKMINKICASDYPSKLFDTAADLGSTKGFFCGHDHYNNMSLEY